MKTRRTTANDVPYTAYLHCCIAYGRPSTGEDCWVEYYATSDRSRPTVHHLLTDPVSAVMICCTKLYNVVQTQLREQVLEQAGRTALTRQYGLHHIDQEKRFPQRPRSGSGDTSTVTKRSVPCVEIILRNINRYTLVDLPDAG